MHRRQVLTLIGATLVVATAPAVAGATKVSVRVEGKSKTLLPATAVSTHGGWITKGGTPTGKCSAGSGAGALGAATHGSWNGAFSASLKDIFIKTILGETDNGPKLYWGIWVNNVASSTGACGVRLHKGDRLLFAAAPFPSNPLAVVAPANARVGASFTVKVLGYNAAGKSKPLPGAHVNGAITNSHGIVHVTANKKGTFVLRISAAHYIRDEASVRVTP
jgi:hypothetical protein